MNFFVPLLERTAVTLDALCDFHIQLGSNEFLVFLSRQSDYHLLPFTLNLCCGGTVTPIPLKTTKKQQLVFSKYVVAMFDDI